MKLEMKNTIIPMSKSPNPLCQHEAVGGELGSRNTSAESGDADLASLLSVTARAMVPKKRLRCVQDMTPMARVTNIRDN